jgi:hypothetical protein
MRSNQERRDDAKIIIKQPGNRAPSRRYGQYSFNIGVNRSDRRSQSSERFCVFLILLSCLALYLQHTAAQGVDPDIVRHLNEPNGSHDAAEVNRSHDPNEINRHLSVTGKLCISVESYANAQVSNKNIYEHWIKASNRCGQNIKVQSCYHKSEDCIVMNVPPWESKNSVLGI